MNRLLALGVLIAVSLSAGCERDRTQTAVSGARSIVVPTQKTGTPSRAFVGATFQADYRKAWCNRTPADLERLSAGDRASMPDLSAVPESDVEMRARQAEEATARHADEAPAVTSSRGRARRSGSVLTVSGARFADNYEEGDSAVVYTYAGRLPTAPFDVVRGAHWEWHSWNLVDARGAQIDLGGPPVASPNGLSFAATGDDVEGESLNGVEIASYANGAFTRVELEASAACNPQWIDDDTLELKVLPGWERFALRPDEARPSDWKTVRVVRDGKGWKLLPPKP